MLVVCYNLPMAEKKKSKIHSKMNKKSIEELRQELGVTPPCGRAKGVPTYLIHSAFRLNEQEATRLIKQAAKLGISESIFIRMCLLKELEDKNAL